MSKYFILTQCAEACSDLDPEKKKLTKRQKKVFVNMKSQLIWSRRDKKKTIYPGFGVIENCNVLEHKSSLEDVVGAERVLRLGVKPGFEYGRLRQVSGTDGH